MNAVLHGLGAGARELGAGEWGATFDDVGGWPLDVGLRIHDGLLRLQAEVLAAGHGIALHALLHRNRLGVLVRYAHSAAGALHVQAELPADATAELLDRTLAALVSAAEWARQGA